MHTSLRPYTLPDAPALLEAALESVAEVNPWLPWCHRDLTLVHATHWIRGQIAARAVGTEYEFMIAGSDGSFLGGCGLNNIDPNYSIANIGYWVRTSAVGQRVATTSVRLLAAWAFQNTRLNRLQILVAQGNAASECVAENAGAVREVVLHHRLCLHGKPFDATMFAITRNTWHAA